MNLNLKLWLRKFLKLIRFFDNIIKILQIKLKNDLKKYKNSNLLTKQIYFELRIRMVYLNLNLNFKKYFAACQTKKLTI